MDYINFTLLLSLSLILFNFLWNLITFPITKLLSYTKNDLIIWLIPKIIMTYLLISLVTLISLHYTNQFPSFKTLVFIIVSIGLVTLFLLSSIVNKELDYEDYLNKFDLTGIHMLSQYNKFKSYEKKIVIFTAILLILFRIFPFLSDNLVTESIANLLVGIYNIKIVGFILSIFCFILLIRMFLNVATFYIKQSLNKI